MTSSDDLRPCALGPSRSSLVVSSLKDNVINVLKGMITPHKNTVDVSRNHGAHAVLVLPASRGVFDEDARLVEIVVSRYRRLKSIRIPSKIVMKSIDLLLMTDTSVAYE